MPENKIVALRNSDEYQQLLENIKAAIITKRAEANMSIIEMKWWIGKEIVDAQPDLERFGYGQNIVGILAKDLGISQPNLYQCIAFYKKLPAEKFDDIVMKLPEGNNLTWEKYVRKYLPETKREKKECEHTDIAVIIQCKGCKKKIVAVNDKIIELCRQEFLNYEPKTE